MKKGKRDSRKRSQEAYGQVWRKFLKELLNARIRTKEQREALAEKMDVSAHSINSMLYRQEGGIDAWVTAISIAYDIRPKDVGSIFSMLKASLKKAAPPSKSDELWLKLDELVDENEKFYWISLLHALVVADKELQKK